MATFLTLITILFLTFSAFGYMKMFADFSFWMLDRFRTAPVVATEAE